MHKQFGGSRTDTLIKLVLIFFISLLSFSVGTFVGKKFSDSQHKLAQLESEYEGEPARGTASVAPNQLDVKPDEALTEKDIQQIADEFTKPEAAGEHPAEGVHVAEAEHGADQPAAGHGTKVAEPIHEEAAPAAAQHPAEHATHETREVASTPAAPVHAAPAAVTPAHAKPETSAPSKAAERVAHGQEPTEHKAEVVNPMPKELPGSVAPSSVGKFTVQISSHQTEDEAKEEAGKLKSKGFSAFVVPATIKGKTWYRVSVGLFEKKDEAKTYRERLLKEAGVSSAFVQQIVK